MPQVGKPSGTSIVCTTPPPTTIESPTLSTEGYIRFPPGYDSTISSDAVS